MILISHRGNTTGQQVEDENRPDYVLSTLRQGYQVEVDVWYDNGWWLGHDKPQYAIREESLKYFWCHAKNAEALWKLKYIHVPIYFWHQNDTYTLTSNGYIWIYQTSLVLPNSICVMPEHGVIGDLSVCAGICSDVIQKYRNEAYN